MDTKLAEIRNRLNTDKEYYNEQFQLLFGALKANIQKTGIKVNREAFDELRKTDAFKSILLDFILMPHASQSRIDQILDHIRIAPTPIPAIPETPILSEEIAASEPVMENLNSQILTFLKNHKYSDFTSFQICKEFGIETEKGKKQAYAIVMKLIENKLVVKEASPYKTGTKTTYRYCPEHYQNNSNLGIACNVVKNIISDFPEIKTNDIRQKIKKYLGKGIRNDTLNNALKQLIAENIITFEVGANRTKYWNIKSSQVIP